MTEYNLFPVFTFDRQVLLRQIVTDLERNEWLAIWAPRHSGRTTLLKRVAEHYRRSEGCLPVYTLPKLHLEPAKSNRLFASLSAHIWNTFQMVHESKADVHPRNLDWEAPDSLREFLSSFLKRTGLRRLVLLLDDCDQLLSTSLVDFLRTLREIHAQRQNKEYQHLHAFTVLVAGTVSFHNLKLLENAEISPFDDWRAIPLEDLTRREAVEYLSSSFASLGLAVDLEALETIVEYGGGDLKRLNQICSAVVQSTVGSAIKRESAARVINHLLATYLADPSNFYMISMIRNDPRCLDVLASLCAGQPKFLSRHLDTRHNRVFGISNPELSGGFLLERDVQGSPNSWRFRNRFTEEILRRHFDTHTMMRVYLDLGRSDKAIPYVRMLENGLARNFRSDIYLFNEKALRDILEARWEHREGRIPQAVARTGSRFRANSSDRVEHAFFLISFLLSEIFGLEDAVLYEKPDRSTELIPINTLPSPPFNSVPVEPISLNDSRLREVRVYRSGVFAVEIEEGDRLKIVIPLKDFRNRLVGVISLRCKQNTQESWATLYITIPIVERSLNFVWRKLSRVEAEQAALLEKVANL